VDKRHIENMLRRIPELESELSQPDLATQMGQYRRLLQEHAALKKLSEKAAHHSRLERQVSENSALAEAADTDDELREMAVLELETLREELRRAESDLNLALLPPDPVAARHAIVEIRAGTGGDEAALFAADLLRMYQRYAEARGWKIAMIDAHAGSLGGCKEAVFSMEGPEAYGHLRFESGGHRVQRVPATEAQGRIHTSAATVAVFPEAEPEDDIVIPSEDLRVDIFCSSGPGGQGVNTTYSAVRVTHLPTGIVAQSQDERSQHRNREKAMTVLKSRILDARRREEEEKQGQNRRTLIGSGDRSERVRTYNFPQNRVTDHRINLTLYNLDRVIEGELDELLQALRQHDVEMRLAKIEKGT
jgi:peptide chain release factor 1